MDGGAEGENMFGLIIAFILGEAVALIASAIVFGNEIKRRRRRK